MSLLTEYWNTLQNALLNFQFMEESIRMYLAYAYWIVSKKLDKQIPFRFTYIDVKNDSLGKLLKKFEKFNSNKQLIDKVKQSIKERNYLAHRAYLMTSEEQKDDEYLSKQIEKMKKIVVSSRECLDELTQESRKLEKIKKSIK
ncbi:hypothetical protein ES702_00958 [subsurface metagenome]